MESDLLSATYYIGYLSKIGTDVLGINESNLSNLDPKHAKLDELSLLKLVMKKTGTILIEIQFNSALFNIYMFF